jgi:hypothetical protein
MHVTWDDIKYSTKRVEQFIDNVNKDDVNRYFDYWQTITPKNDYDYYLRWIFAFMSIHTGWKSNVAGFLAVKALPENFNAKQLFQAIKGSGVGLTIMRTRAIWEFHRRYWLDPKSLYPQSGESLPECRDRLTKTTFGIGLTKTAFLLEMSFPEKCNVVCLDTHILQLYDWHTKATPNYTMYRKMEKHWTKTCARLDVCSPMVRHIWWDHIQKKSDCRYWSYCLEK